MKKNKTLPGKPNWTFSIEETSAGVYEISCSDGQGRKVAIKGTDPDSLISQATTEINRIESGFRG
jgi:hypothetical protein